MQKRLFLLDAYALIYRSYYAFIKNPRINSKGLNTSAIFGFINTLEDLLKRENPSHIAIAFDPKGGSFRNQLFDQYKAKREETPEDIRKAVPIIKDLMHCYNIPIFEVVGYEADDVIGTLAKQTKAAGFSVYMMTPDKDYAQLVEENISVFRPKFGGNDFELLDVEGVKSKYGFKDPIQMIDLLGLMGDASDNIPGCPGVGEVTAKKLIDQFGSIENLLVNTDQLKGAVKNKVEQGRELIELSKQLATICIDVPVQWTEEALVRKPIDSERLSLLLDELEMRTLKQRIITPQKSVPQQTTPSLFDEPSLFDATTESEPTLFSSLKTIDNTPHKYHLVETDEELDRLIEQLSLQSVFAIDTETTSLDPVSAELVGISFSWNVSEAHFILCPEDRAETLRIVDKLKVILENPTVAKVGQNLKYDWIILKNYGATLRGRLFDTMIAHYLLQPEGRHGMDILSEQYLNYQTVHIDQLIGAKGKDQKSMRNVAKDLLKEYACEDADVTLQLYQAFDPLLDKHEVRSLFEEIEMPLMPVLGEMERVGVRLDTAALGQSSERLAKVLVDIEQQIYDAAGETFNINSAKQVGDILFAKLQIDPKAKKTKTGQYATSEETLVKLKEKHPIVALILEQRGIKKLLSTYINALPELINPGTGKIHTSFNQTVTATGRLSSSNPNLQNIPIRDEEGREIRKAFVPDEDALFFSADYSQIELRIMAHLSEDASMIDAFRSGIDIHAATAAKIYKVPLEEVTKDMRRKAKTANFGIIYGISVFGLAERLNIPRGEAKELIEGYFENYPAVKAYMDRSIALAKEQGAAFTLFHRKRTLPDINSNNAIVRGFAERNAINAPIQGTAADIIKKAMIEIYRRFEEEGLRSKMILQVHDELNFSVLKEEQETVRRIVIESMEQACELSVPLTAESAFGANWFEAH